MRGFFQHSAVRDCNLHENVYRQLRMKLTVTANADIFHEFRSALFKARQQIPRTAKDPPVVPHAFDPYRACLMETDHLLTGHFRDCLNLVLKLLLSKEYISKCEQFMLAFLREANLPIQNRLVDHDRKALLQMSMTELYALSNVAYSALLAGSAQIIGTFSQYSPLPIKCQEAIDLVRSCSELISALWLLPIPTFDGSSAAKSFECRETRLRQIQNQAEAHLMRVISICHMKDEDVLML